MEKCGEEARNKSVQGGMRCVFHIPRIKCAPAHPARLHTAKELLAEGRELDELLACLTPMGFKPLCLLYLPLKCMQLPNGLNSAGSQMAHASLCSNYGGAKLI